MLVIIGPDKSVVPIITLHNADLIRLDMMMN